MLAFDVSDVSDVSELVKLCESRLTGVFFSCGSVDRQPITDLRSLRVSISDFEVKKVIGRGHFGEVKVVKEKATGEVFAMKTLRKNETLSQQAVAFYEEERDIMAQAQDTKWIPKLHYAYQVS